MKKCLKIHVVGRVQDHVFKTLVQKQAQELGLEGTLQNAEDQNVIVYVRGGMSELDLFIDNLYKDIIKNKIHDILTEPFTQERDFRGVFRIIE